MVQRILFEKYLIDSNKRRIFFYKFRNYILGFETS